MSGVVIVGSSNEDIVLEVTTLPSGGETVAARRMSRSSGGKGANQAVAAARLGAAVELVAAVGSDPSGRRVLDAIGASGVGTSHIDLVDDVPTGAAYIAVDDTGENTIIVAGGANLRLDPARLSGVDLRDTVVGLCMEVPDSVIEAAVDQAATAGGTLVLNMSPLRALAPRILDAIDVLLVNEHEANELAGGPVRDAGDVRNLRVALGVRALVITLGARGAAIDTGDRVEYIDSPVIDAVDTTGCGDAFAGSLIAALAAGRSMVSATRFATTVGAYAATKRGAQPSYPNLEQLREWTSVRGIAEPGL